jgi:hypothetical protein
VKPTWVVGIKKAARVKTLAVKGARDVMDGWFPLYYSTSLAFG